MPGIVTSTGLASGSSIKTYKGVVTSTSTSLAINFVTGTTATSTANCQPADKGIMVIFQNQSTAVSVVVGAADVTAITAFAGAQGIVLGALSTAASNIPSSFTVFSAGSYSAIQMTDWYFLATSSGAVVAAQLIKGV